MVKSDLINYNKIWTNSEKLNWCVLLTTGRVGSDFFQSLLDGHPEIYTFNGVLRVNDFWEISKVTKNPKELVLDDIIDEFIGHYIHKFKSKYDILERKNQLGEKQNKSIDISTKEFKFHMNGFLKGKKISSKNFLRAVYLSWSCCKKEDFNSKKIFFHHLHHIWKLAPFINDYPETKIISMTRDPRASYVSGVENWNNYSATTKHLSHVYFVLNRTIEDASSLKRFKNDFRVLKLEDLGKKNVLEKFCKWVGIEYSETMKYSTWNGLRWWGDKLSQTRILKNEKGFSKSITNNSWEKKLGIIEKILLNFLLYNRLKCYGYDFNYSAQFPLFIFSLFLIPIPTKYEWQYISPKKILILLIQGKFRNIFSYKYYYILRVILFYKLFFNRFFNKKFDLPVIRDN